MMSNSVDADAAPRAQALPWRKAMAWTVGLCLVLGYKQRWMLLGLLLAPLGAGWAGPAADKPTVIMDDAESIQGCLLLLQHVLVLATLPWATYYLWRRWGAGEVEELAEFRWSFLSWTYGFVAAGVCWAVLSVIPSDLEQLVQAARSAGEGPIRVSVLSWTEHSLATVTGMAIGLSAAFLLVLLAQARVSPTPLPICALTFALVAASVWAVFAGVSSAAASWVLRGLLLLMVGVMCRRGTSPLGQTLRGVLLSPRGWFSQHPSGSSLAAFADALLISLLGGSLATFVDFAEFTLKGVVVTGGQTAGMILVAMLGAYFADRLTERRLALGGLLRVFSFAQFPVLLWFAVPVVYELWSAVLCGVALRQAYGKSWRQIVASALLAAVALLLFCVVYLALGGVLFEKP